MTSNYDKLYLGSYERNELGNCRNCNAPFRQKTESIKECVICNSLTFNVEFATQEQQAELIFIFIMKKVHNFFWYSALVSIFLFFLIDFGILNLEFLYILDFGILWLNIFMFHSFLMFVLHVVGSYKINKMLKQLKKDFFGLSLAVL